MIQNERGGGGIQNNMSVIFNIRVNTLYAIITIARKVDAWTYMYIPFNNNEFVIYIYLAPHGGRARYCNAHVCLCVCVFVCVFVCPCFRKISKCNISAISQPIIMKLGIHITYGTP